MKTHSFAAALALMSFAPPLHAQNALVTQSTNLGPVSMDGFVGARVRITLDGARIKKDAVRVGLTIAPMQRRGGSEFRGTEWRIGEGLELGFNGDAPKPQLSLAGMRLTPASYAPDRQAPTKSRNNLSDGGTVALVVVGLAAAVGLGLLAATSDSKSGCTGGECNNN